jgi:hypothetical protein
MKVLSALQWLQENNQFYKDIIIDHAALQSLPEDNVPPELLTVDMDGDEGENPYDGDSQSGDIHSFLPLPTKEPTEDTAIRSIVNGDDPIDWPDIAN